MFPDAQILKVNLSSGKIETQIIPGETYRLYPGGSALGLYLTLKELKPRIDPLSPENFLAFTVSPLTGLPISGISRMCVTAKSPLTGAIGDSQAGGFIASHLKLNGWDGVLFIGMAPKPVYLYIDGKSAQLKSAEHIWGNVTGETERLIREDLGEKNVEIACIGPAGENLVRFACIINMCNRANGRNGMGAVMGSKNLKALVVKKSKGAQIHNREDLLKLSKSVKKRLEENDCVAGIGKFGTAGDLEGFNEEGFLATNNWNSGYFGESAREISGTKMLDTLLIGRDTCFACAVNCKRVVEVKGIVDPLYGGPEYETIAAFGSYCGISSLESICVANQLCNMYGLDTISCGATISFAMECYDNGLIKKEDLSGIELKFGAGAAMTELVEKIAKREGFGDILAEGSLRAAKRIGAGSEKFSMSVKGQELPAHMPQYKPAVGLIYAVNPFGADHQSSEHDTVLMLPVDSQERIRLAQLGLWKSYGNSDAMDDEKVRFALETQKYFSVLDTLCLCQFVWGPSWELFGPDDIVLLCKSGIGWETSLYELMLVGERRINMMRYFNAKEGFTKEDDTLPDKIFKPLLGGPSDGKCLDREVFERSKELYYQLAGWDEKDGNPTQSTMKKLSLGWMQEL